MLDKFYHTNIGINTKAKLIPFSVICKFFLNFFNENGIYFLSLSKLLKNE